ncbi:MAG: S8 family serine peptidase [Pseudomonadota bacterium]|nr:S8 family serine peptidase [Pseudomonadota bacterium]
MKRYSHLLLKVRSHCVIAHAPAHLDVLAGASRPLGHIDGGGCIDACLRRRTDASRVQRVFHACHSLGHIGEQGSGYNDQEKAIGLDRTLAVEISDPRQAEALVQDLRALNAVEWATVEALACAPLAQVAQSLDWQSGSTPHERVNAQQALAMETGDKRVVVAVIDTGIALEHQELAQRLRAGFDTVDLGMGMVASGIRLVGDSRGRDFCPRDETGHGTHVAGIIGARGLRLPPGLAGNAALLPVRALAAAALDDSGENLVGVGGILDIDAAIKVAVDLGAKVLNMSFGTPASQLESAAPPPHADVIHYALNKGVIPVAAIGNSGKQERYYPAALPDVIAVGSMDSRGQRSAFSTWGEHITLCAPGEAIPSLGMEGYLESTGTSHAAPFVAATVALMVARARRQGVELDAPTARHLLAQSASDGPHSHNPETGFGMLNASGALQALDSMLARKGETSW